MRFQKIIALTLGIIISLMPLSAISATKNAKQHKSKTALTKNKSLSKAKLQRKKKVVKSAKNKQKSALTHHSKESKSLAVIKGARLVPTKIIDKQYSYRQNGGVYTTLNKYSSSLYSKIGGASYYGRKFHGRKTANGEIYNMNAYTAAHKTLALGSYALVTNLRNGRKIIVRINDRGPFSKNRIIDLSVASAKAIGMYQYGVAKVKVEGIIVDNNGNIFGKGAESLSKQAKK